MTDQIDRMHQTHQTHQTPSWASPASPGSPSPAPSEDAASARERREHVIRLVFILAVGIAIAVATDALPTVAVVVALVLMIMLHELGHFVMAKRAGMKVTEFFLGFGPRLWSVRKGETEYGVKALPLGGYVKIIGMSNLDHGIDPRDEPRTYRQKPFRQRLAVAVAGSTVHMLIAFVLLFVIWTMIGVPNYSHARLQIGDVLTLPTGPSPAAEAGVHVGDRLVSIEGCDPLTTWDALVTCVQKRPGETTPFTVERDGRRLTLPIHLLDHNPDTGDHVGFAGISPVVPVEHANVFTAVGRSAVGLKDGVVASGQALGHFFAPGSLHAYFGQLNGEPSRSSAKGGSGGSGSSDTNTRFYSPLGIGRVAHEAANAGIRYVLLLLIEINVFVGVLNMFPLLPLDGGHVAIAVYERVRSRRGRRYRADVSKMLPVSAALVAVLGVIFVTSLWLDIVRPAGNPFPH